METSSIELESQVEVPMVKTVMGIFSQWDQLDDDMVALCDTETGA